jgi:predicted alpha/beta-fold hydrolase
MFSAFVKWSSYEPSGAGVPVTSPRLYTPGHTDDLRLALIYISQIYPQAPLFGVGFSMGAGILIRYLAEEGASSRLVSGCALACVSSSSVRISLTYRGYT